LKINELIKQGRIKKGMTMVELANKIGSTHASISSWESGKSQPNVKYMYALSDILEIDFNQSINPLIVNEDSPSYGNKYNKIIEDLVSTNKKLVDMQNELINNNTSLTKSIVELVNLVKR
jgi:transcriptional regulator with XRE-family HTH domain